MDKIKLMLLFLSIFIGLGSLEPWENDDIPEDPFEEKLEYNLDLTKEYSGKLIDFYQKKISSKTISRCPFKVSCSKFALEMINKHGFVIGCAYFIDRNQFRENTGAYFHYPLSENERGELKLDDSFYLK